MSWAGKLALPAAWILYAQAVEPTGVGWQKLIETFGLPIALVIFFVWQAWVDKKNDREKLGKLENFIETTLLHAIETCASREERLIASLDEVAETIKKCKHDSP